MATGAHTPTWTLSQRQRPHHRGNTRPIGRSAAKTNDPLGVSSLAASDGGRVVVFTWYLKSIDIMPMKYTNVHIILIRQFREALLLLYFLVSQFLEALSVLSGGLESKALDNSLPRDYFHKEVSTTNRLSIHHFLPPTFNVANHLNAWEAAGRDVVPWSKTWIQSDRHAWIFRRQSGGPKLRFFKFIIRCFKHPQNGKIKQTSWSTIVLSTCLPPAFSSHIMRLIEQILNYFIDAVMNPHPRHHLTTSLIEVAGSYTFSSWIKSGQLFGGVGQTL